MINNKIYAQFKFQSRNKQISPKIAKFLRKNLFLGADGDTLHRRHASRRLYLFTDRVPTA